MLSSCYNYVENCLSCSSTYKCKECQSGYELESNECICIFFILYLISFIYYFYFIYLYIFFLWKSNNNNTYLYSFFYYKDIEECTIQHCDECNAKGTTCLTCDDGYVLDTDTSSGLTSCSLPTTCMIENCLKCNSAFTKCVTCDGGYSITSAGKCATCEINNCQVCTDIEDC